MNTAEFIAKTIRPEVQALKAYPVTPPWTGIKIELMEDNHLDVANNTATSAAMREADWAE